MLNQRLSTNNLLICFTIAVALLITLLNNSEPERPAPSAIETPTPALQTAEPLIAIDFEEGFAPIVTPTPANKNETSADTEELGKKHRIITNVSIPEHILDILRDGLRNARAGNTEYAALLSIEAAEQLPENKAFAAQMYFMAGRYYEQLLFIETATEQYHRALQHVEKHPASYKALRRLDAEFAEQNPPLPEKKKKTKPTKTKVKITN